MTVTEIAERLAEIKAEWPDADTFKTRTYGGPGEVFAVIVERNDDAQTHEIVFHTRSW